MPSPFDQSDYQVRLEWGVPGLARLAPADVIVVVDVLRFSSRALAAVGTGGRMFLDAAVRAISINGAAVLDAAAATGSLVLVGGLRNAAAVAQAVLEEQERRGGRTSVSVIAAGERETKDSGAALRFAVEDLLGAGAVVAALTDVGIDHCSPEAVVASEALRALAGATTHLITASGSGRELAACGRDDDVLDAAERDDSAVVPELRDGVLVAR